MTIIDGNNNQACDSSNTNATRAHPTPIQQTNTKHHNKK